MKNNFRFIPRHLKSFLIPDTGEFSQLTLIECKFTILSADFAIALIIHLNFGKTYSLISMFVNRFIFCFISMFWFSAQAQELFSEISFREAVEQADTENKHVYVFGITSWCDLCEKMNVETLADSALRMTLNQNLISLKIDLETAEGIDFAVKFRASPAPQHLFFDADGYLVKRAQGFFDSESFLELINAAGDSLPELAPLPYPLDFTLDYPDWYRDFRKAPRQSVFPEAGKIESFLDSRDSITDEVTWAILYSLPTPEKYVDKIIANKDVLAYRYGKNEVLEKLSSFVFADVKQAIKDQSESALYAAMRKADRLLGSDADIYKIRYQLYYYQYHHNWRAYTEIGAELARNKALKTGDWLNEIAANIYRHTTDYGSIKLALDWMYPLIETEEDYDYFITTARLENALGNTDEALSLVKKALASAEDEADTRDAEKLIKTWEED